MSCLHAGALHQHWQACTCHALHCILSTCTPSAQQKRAWSTAVQCCCCCSSPLTPPKPASPTNVALQPAGALPDATPAAAASHCVRRGRPHHTADAELGHPGVCYCCCCARVAHCPLPLLAVAPAPATAVAPARACMRAASSHATPPPGRAHSIPPLAPLASTSRPQCTARCCWPAPSPVGLPRAPPALARMRAVHSAPLPTERTALVVLRRAQEIPYDYLMRRLGGASSDQNILDSEDAAG